MSALNLDGSHSVWHEPDGATELRCERKRGDVIAAARCLAAQRDGCTCPGRARVAPDTSPQAVEREDRLSEVVRLSRSGATRYAISDALAITTRSVSRYRLRAVALGLLPALVVRSKVVIAPGSTKPCECCGTPYGPKDGFASKWLGQRYCRPRCRDAARRRAYLARVRAEVGL